MTTAVLGHGVYSLPEAARLVGVQPRRIRAWFAGWPNRAGGPVIRSDYSELGTGDAISFLDLVDVVLVSRLRDLGVSLPTIRRAYSTLAEELQSTHPFSREDLLCDENGRLFLWAAGRDHLVEIIRQQHAFPSILLPHLQRIRFDPDTRLASQIAPMQGVVIDPTRRYGKPIVASAGVPTEILHAAFLANGKNAAVVANWYSVLPEDVELAHRFESTFSGLAA